eukprot:Hpha_TRINITY_DN17268_c0_g1::TRINITY_DN17268_c0_g1_i1::g.17941::m.17941
MRRRGSVRCATIFNRRELGEARCGSSEPEELLRLSAEDYVARFNVGCYLSDVVHQLLETRDERPLEFIAEYFIAVTRGTHVLQRSHAFLTATLHNRRAFAGLLQLVAASSMSRLIPRPLGGLECGEMLQLVQLLCPDFPSSTVRTVLDALRAIDADRSLPQVAAALGVELYYGEQLAELRSLFAGDQMPLQLFLLELRAVVPRLPRAQSIYGRQTRPGLVPLPLLEEAAHAAVARSALSASATAQALPAAVASTAVIAAVASGCYMQGEAPQVLRPHPPVLPWVCETQRSSTGSSGDALQALTAQSFCAAIYLSERVQGHMRAQHPILTKGFGEGVEELAASVLSAHDAAVLTWRRRKQRRSRTGSEDGQGRAEGAGAEQVEADPPR